MQKNYKTFIEWIAVIAIISFLIIHCVIRRCCEEGIQWGWESIWGDIGYTTLFVGFLAFLFNRFMWRNPHIGKWFHTPYLQGEWEGKGYSSYNDQDFACTFKIKQTFLQTHVHAIFEKSESRSFCSVFIYDDFCSGQVRVQKLAKWANDFWPNGGIGKIFCIFVVAIKAIQYGKSI